MNTTTLNIDDMHCANCIGKIRAGLNQLEGITQLNFNPARRQVVVSHESELQSHELLSRVERIGFHPYLSGINTNPGKEAEILRRDLLKRLGIAGLAMMQVMMVAISLYAGAFTGMETEYRRILEFTALLFCIPVFSYSAMPFFTSALRSIKGGLSMDVPIALAIGIAFVASSISTLSGAGEVYYDSVVMFTFLLLLARYIDLSLKHQVDAEDALMRSLPQNVTLLVEGKRVLRSLAQVNVGDILWVGEGEQIPVDGDLLSDIAMVDEALLTGEDHPCDKSQGDTLYAGTYNLGAGITLKVSAKAEETRVAAINQLASETLLAKNGMAKLSDRIAGIFIPGILLMAFMTFIGWSFVDSQQAFSASLAVLVISCPCALSLAIPAALSAAMVRLRHAGVVLKDSKYLETLPRVTDIFMDKTGTLTLPESGIGNVSCYPGYDAEWCLTVAGSLQKYSSHPLARCFAEFDLPVSSVKSVVGAGVQANLDGRCLRIGSAGFCNFSSSVATNKVFLSVDGLPAAIFDITNPLRESAQATIKMLRKDDKNIHVISGDRKENCASIARSLGLGFDAEQTPEDKWHTLKSRMDANHLVMFVGDGANDLPSLAGADVSVAMLESNDLVKSRADIILFTTRLGALVDLFSIAKSARNIVRQNLAWAFMYNIIAIPAAALGWAPPWMAAAGMALSSTLVMLNSTRLLRTPLFLAEAK